VMEVANSFEIMGKTLREPGREKSALPTVHSFYFYLMKIYPMGDGR
jgi:hypothetical protein